MSKVIHMYIIYIYMIFTVSVILCWLKVLLRKGVRDRLLGVQDSYDN